jgi:O-antigen ligase
MIELKKNSNFFLELISWLFVFIPAAFIIGPFFINSITTVIVVVYLIIYFKNHILKINNRSLFFLKVFFSFNLYLFISSLLGETPLVSIFSSVSYLRYIFLILAISFILERNFYYLKYFFYVSFFCIIFLFYDVLVQFFTNQNLLGFINSSSDRFTGFFGKEQISGSYSVRFLPIILFLVNFFYFKKNKFFLQILVISLILFLVLVSGERTSLFMCAVYFVFFIIINKKLKLTAQILSIFLILFICASLYKQPLKQRFIDTTLNQLFTTSDDSSNFSFLSVRHENHIKTSINIFKKNIFFGSGPNSFRYICADIKYSVRDEIYKSATFKSKFDGYLKLDLKEDASQFYEFNVSNPTSADIKGFIIDNNNKVLENFTIPWNSKIISQNNTYVSKGQHIFIKNIPYENGCNTHPHNFIFQILAELGLFGVIFYLFFLLKLFLIIFKNIYNLYFKNKVIHSKNTLLILGAFLINFFPFIPTGGFFNSWLMTICLLPAGLLFFLQNNNIKK